MQGAQPFGDVLLKNVCWHRQGEEGKGEPGVDDTGMPALQGAVHPGDTPPDLLLAGMYERHREAILV